MSPCHYTSKVVALLLEFSALLRESLVIRQHGMALLAEFAGTLLDVFLIAHASNSRKLPFDL
jgi:hypothetical protein